MYTPLRYIPFIFYKARPIQFTFFVTRRCNARCPFCFYLQNPLTAAEAADELSLEEIERVVRGIGSLLWLSFSGGEPFLRDEIVDITGLFYRYTRPSVILYSTNGLMPERISTRVEEILRLCPGSVITVKLSLDGFRETHDRMRGVNGAYELVMKTYGNLRALLDRHRNLELGINTVLCRENEGEIEGLIEEVTRMEGIKTHTVSVVRGEGLNGISPERYLMVSEMLNKNIRRGITQRYSFRGAALKSAQDILQRRIIYRTLIQRRQLLGCVAGRLTLVMTEDGRLYPCESFTTPLGNIRDSGYDIKKLLDAPSTGDILQMISNRGCYCSHECYNMMNILFNIKTYPRLLLEYLRLKLHL